jgi:thioester reductase-like protein
MAMEDSGLEDKDTTTLTGEYHHDKAIIRNLVNGYLQDGGIPLTDERLNIIPNYVSEAMTQVAGKLQKIQRFAVLLPLTVDMGMAMRECEFTQ